MVRFIFRAELISWDIFQTYSGLVWLEQKMHLRQLDSASTILTNDLAHQLEEL